jgi:hypothetical protein
MKIFRINESQLRRLFESSSDSDILDGEDTTKKFGSENTTQAIITTPDGDEEYSNPVKSSDIEDAIPDNNFMKQAWRAPNITI